MGRFNHFCFLRARRIWALLGLTVIGPSCSAKRAADRQEASARPAESHHAENFASSADERMALLRLGIDHAHARLGAWHYEGRTHLKIVSGTRQYESRNTAILDVDASGARELTLTTPRGRIEQLTLGDSVYVRFGTGEVRKKTLRDMETNALSDQAFDASRQALVVVGPLAWQGPKTGDVLGRPTLQFAASASRDDAPGHETNKPKPMDEGPVILDRAAKALVGRWRDEAKLDRVQAKLDFDQETGVLLSASIKAEFTSTLTAPKSLVVTLEHERRISDIGRVTARRAPSNAVPEFRRVVRDRDPLAFFRDVLPRPQVEKTNKQDVKRSAEESEEEPLAEGPDDSAPNDELSEP